MSNLVRESLLSAYHAAAAEHGVRIRYWRKIPTGWIGSELWANPGESLAEVLDPQTGGLDTVELRDWYILADELKVPWPPARGDLVQFHHAGVCDTFDVTHPDPNHQPYTAADAHGVVHRIHSRLRAIDFSPEKQPQ